MRFSLRAKIVVPFVLIVALVGTIGTAAVTALVTSEAVAEFNASLLRASLLANDHLSLVEAARLTTLRAAAATTWMAEALSAIAASIGSSGGADLTFYGPTGSVLEASLSSTSALPAATMGLVQPDQPVRFSQSSGGQTYMNLLSDWTMRKMRLGYL